MFQYALLNTSEFDLARALYLRARSAERWLDQRQTYTRSLAVMSMIGYVLGLGDRHPCNLMVERHSGAVVHIDFGDCKTHGRNIAHTTSHITDRWMFASVLTCCLLPLLCALTGFDVAQLRDKYPEKVPFRLTRMMVAAMDCGALYGSYVSLCSAVMATVRKNKNSVMALLEAFVYDPLISWRLLDTNKQNASTAQHSTAGTQDNTQPTSPRSPLSPVPPPPQPPSLSRRTSTVASRRPSTTLSLYPPTASHAQAVEVGTNPASRDRRRSIIAVSEDEERERRLDEGRAAEEDEELNERAVAVIARIGRKLRGTDFDDRDERKGDGEKDDSSSGSRELAGDGGGSGAVDVQAQVDRLIREATSHINLCQSYIGWCSFW